jgi:peptide/nickel transport system substrate-binding protein
VGYGSLGQSSEFSLFENPHRLRPPFTNAAIAWRNWYNSGGKEGQEPSAEVKELYEITVRWQATRPGSEEYMRLGKEAVTLYTEGLYNIGMVGMPPVPLMVRNSLRNTPTQEMLDKPTWTWDYRFFAPFHPDQWFFAE